MGIRTTQRLKRWLFLVLSSGHLAPSYARACDFHGNSPGVPIPQYVVAYNQFCGTKRNKQKPSDVSWQFQVSRQPIANTGCRRKRSIVSLFGVLLDGGKDDGEGWSEAGVSIFHRFQLPPQFQTWYIHTHTHTHCVSVFILFLVVTDVWLFFSRS